MITDNRIEQEEIEFDDIEDEVKLDSTGEESEDELKTDFLDRISDVVTWSTDWTVGSFKIQLEKGTIDFDPVFQRRDAWDNKKKSKFIESLIWGLPIPQIVLAEKSKGRYIIVDGKQRLLTIKQFCVEESNSRLVLRGLNNEILNGLDYKSLETEQEELFDGFLNQTIRSVIIKNWPSENLLYTIFYRLNTGSLKLSPQELRRALNPGKFLDFVEEFSVNNTHLKNVFKYKKPDFRMRDIELVIRYFAFSNLINEYEGNYKETLDKICEDFNANWDNRENEAIRQAEKFNQAIENGLEVFGNDNIFRKWKDNRFETRLNRAIFDIIVYYLKDIDIILIRDKKEDILVAFKDLCDNNSQFYKSISSNTNNLKETSTRFAVWGLKFAEIIGLDNSIVPQNLLTHYLSINDD